MKVVSIVLRKVRHFEKEHGAMEVHGVSRLHKLIDELREEFAMLESLQGEDVRPMMLSSYFDQDMNSVMVRSAVRFGDGLRPVSDVCRHIRDKVAEELSAEMNANSEWESSDEGT